MSAEDVDALIDIVATSDSSRTNLAPTYLLDAWLAWATRSRLEAFVEVERTIRANLTGIYAVLVHGISNARVEAANTKLQLLTRLAFGFHSHAPLIGLAMLELGGLCPPLPKAA